MFITLYRYLIRKFCGWIAIFLLLVCPVNAAVAQSTERDVASGLTIVLSEEGGPYLEFSNALRKILVGRTVAQVVIDSGQPMPNSGLVIAVGMKAATAVAASDATFVLNVLIPKSGHERLLKEYPFRAASQSYSTIYLDQPLQRQVRLLTAIFPDRHNIGILYSSPPKELVQLKRDLAKRGLKLHEQSLDSGKSFSEALQEILRSSEVIFALPDALVYNSSTLRNILLSTYRSNVPLVGFSSGYVKAGALCAVFSTPAQIAAQAAALIARFGVNSTLPPAEYPSDFEVLVNEQVARSLGLKVKSSSELQDEIESEEGEQ